MSTSLDIIREVDSFIQQAKLEGDISCSISSVGSNSTGMSIPTAKSSKLNVMNQINNLVTSNEDLTQFVCDDNCKQIKQKFKVVDEDCSKVNSKNFGKNNNLSKNVENLMELDSSEEVKLIFDKSATYESVKARSKNKNLSINENDKFIKNRGKSLASEDENSCDSSIVELGNDSNNSKIPYVSWLQEHRSKQSITSDKTDSKHSNQRGAVHVHHVNSALFWERWLDNVFEAFDRWMTYSSESESEDEDEDEDLRMLRVRSLNDFRRRRINDDKTNRIKSEPIITRKPVKSTQLKNLRYKCPSYVDWLIKKRRESSYKSESEEESEEKESENYWSSLYGKLTKSLSSMISGKSKEEESLLNVRPQSAPQARGTNTNTLSRSKNSLNLRKAFSQTCGHDYENVIRYRQLSEESVESPVLTDQLVELVCNTLSPETTDDSSNDENLRRRNRSYKKSFKRKL